MVNELRFDGVKGNRSAKVFVSGYDATVECYLDKVLEQKKGFTNWTEDTSSSRSSINFALKYLDDLL